MSSREPRRDHYRQPATDEHSERALNDAIQTIAVLRGMLWQGDTAIALHALTSLQAEIELRLPRAVADARDSDLSWAEIADLIGVTRASAWQRYAGRTKDNRTPLNPD